MTTMTPSAPIVPILPVSDRLGQTEEYYFSSKLRELAELRAQGRDILNLGIGSPDLPPRPGGHRRP